MNYTGNRKGRSRTRTDDYGLEYTESEPDEAGSSKEAKIKGETDVAIKNEIKTSDAPERKRFSTKSRGIFRDNYRNNYTISDLGSKSNENSSNLRNTTKMEECKDSSIRNQFNHKRKRQTSYGSEKHNANCLDSVENNEKNFGIHGAVLRKQFNQNVKDMNKKFTNPNDNSTAQLNISDAVNRNVESNRHEKNEVTNKNKKKDFNYLSWEKSVDKVVIDIIKVHYAATSHRGKFDGTHTIIDEFFKPIRWNRLRTLTVYFLTKCFNKMISMDGHCEQLRVCLNRYRLFVQSLPNNAINAVTKGTIPLDLFTGFLKILKNVKITQDSGIDLDFLLHLKNPDTEEIRHELFDFIKTIVDDKDTFQNAINMIAYSKLDDVKNVFLEKIILNAHIMNFATVLDKLITTKEEKINHVKLLDDIIYKSRRNIPLTDDESKVVKHFKEKIVGVASKWCKKYELDSQLDDFYFYIVQVINDVRYKYNREKGEETDDLIAKSIGGRDMKFRTEFLYSINKKGNYLDIIKWGLFFKVPKSKLPKMVLPFYDECYEEAMKFKEMMVQRVALYVPNDISFQSDIYNIEYNVNLISTIEGLVGFCGKFEKDKPRAIGIDCEAGGFASGWCGKATLIQIATDKDSYLIDIMTLYEKRMDEDKWRWFFEIIFSLDITRYGFNFESDYAFLGAVFPWLFPFFTQEEHQVFSLDSLLKLIMTVPKLNKIVFEDNDLKLPSQLNLGAVAEHFLGIKADKTMQTSNWTCRPMSQLQLVYAANDAAYTYHVSEKILNYLKEKLEKDEFEKLIEPCYILGPIRGPDKKLSPVKPVVKSTVKYYDLFKIIEHLNNKIVSAGEPYRKSSDITVILDSPMCFMISYFNNLGIKTIDVRVDRAANKDKRSDLQILKDKLKNDPDLILITTEKRKDNFKEHPVSNVLCMPVTNDNFVLEHISIFMKALNLYIDPGRFYTLCEKCSSTNLYKLPAPVFKLVYLISLITVKKMEPSWDEIKAAAQEAKEMDPKDYYGLEFTPEIIHSKSLIPDLFFNIGKLYSIKPFSRAVYLQTEDTENFQSYIFKATEKTYKASKPGICHIVCLDCGNIYNRDDSEVEDAFDNTVKSQPATSDIPNVRENICKMFKDIFSVKEKSYDEDDCI